MPCACTYNILLQTDGSRFLRVVHAGELCDIVQAVHADELKHSGYKKVMEYVSYDGCS